MRVDLVRVDLEVYRGADLAGLSCSGFGRVSVNQLYLFQSTRCYPNTGQNVGIVVFGKERLRENSHVYYFSADSVTGHREW